MPNYKGYTPNKRTQEYCEQAARTCKSIGEFWSKHRSAATKAHLEGWIDSYTWLERGRAKRYSLDEDECRRIASQYRTNKDFRTHEPSAYVISCKNGWLESFTWLKREMDTKHFHTYEEIAKISKKFKTMKDFREKCPNECHYAWEHGWLKSFTWLKRARIRSVK
jgi:hypothetical protein